MSEKRKPTTEARIELHLWFRDLVSYQHYGATTFAERAKSVSDREWIDPRVYPDGHIEVRFRFTHACRNDGNQRSDSRRFFDGTRRRAGVDELSAVLSDVVLVSRERFPEPSAVRRPPVQLWTQPETRPSPDFNLDLWTARLREAEIEMSL